VSLDESPPPPIFVAFVVYRQVYCTQGPVTIAIVSGTVKDSGEVRWSARGGATFLVTIRGQWIVLITIFQFVITKKVKK
jgi:hypothetical protein